MKLFRLCVLLAALFISPACRASLVLPLPFEQHMASADAVFRGREVSQYSALNGKDGLIYTITIFQVEEAFKGTLPALVKMSHRGGALNGVGFRDDLSPRFRSGEDCLIFATRRADGSLFAAQGEGDVVPLSLAADGAVITQPNDWLTTLRTRTLSRLIPGADVRDQSPPAANVGFTASPSGDVSGPSTNGLLADSFGIPSRSTLCDEGEPIPYWVDATVLPAGISLTQALNAVSNAMAAWASASSFRFVFLGTTNFGEASADINAGDGVFRVQLHDSYHFIPAGNILGVGGSYYSQGLLTNANWGPGGRVAGLEFNQVSCGFVVMNHTNAALQSLSTFTEVLTHEVGHMLGLAHSSDVITNNPVLTNSIMYFEAHADGRGNRLDSYDTNVVRLVHPLSPPPYTFDRVMNITMAATPPNVPGINQVQLRGYSVSGSNLVLVVTNETAFNGTFSTSGDWVSYTSPDFGSDSPQIDPSTSSYYDLLYGRYYDGTNASPYAIVRVLSYRQDSDSPSDGIPDSWMTNYFGHAAPMASDKSRASDDADGDQLTNLQEYLAGMNPRDASSAQRITFHSNAFQWQAKPYELYEIETNADLHSTNWARFGPPVLVTNSVGSVTIPLNLNSTEFFRVLRVP